jgi:hypothetical protein
MHKEDKMSRKILVPCYLSLFLLFSTIVVSDVVAAWLPPANKDVCWGTSDFTLRLRFINVGGGYYQIVGKASEPGGIIGAFFGSALTTTNVLQCTATSSGADSSNVWMEIARFKINRTTLKLTAYGSGMEKNGGTYFDGPMTLPKITCP